ncbi:DUF1302 family protein [Jiulongibacter sediminis]|uniref:DUF5723 domain-containing protein n=1 Tax=Jiulongibacter sediminis TaxID=1605367 RepID=A0A0N8H9A8_9BACT|nr:DUF1302 family protein [Jiulongibacter sediminis]KPM46852.1 hypothetical protein AFM12_16560 [Jiulongibacter sediminis]TBX22202.1 hypothetical protein TK44_16570 [Jiulongibacter sediminis]
MKKLYILILLLNVASLAAAQDSLQTKRSFKEVVQINGYLKNMQTVNFVDLNEIGIDNLVHNRINIKAYISDNLTASVGWRNRIIFGDQVASIPGYGSNLDFDTGLIDMSWVLVNKDPFVLHSTIDRLNLNYVKNNLEVTIGRQRINWGRTLAWNPNDLFNTYNFIDFDYEERPGTDAIRAQYYLPNGMSSFDFAINRDALGFSTYAGKFQFNTAGYDVQLIAGKYIQDVAAGVGWAGSLGNVGFKGEATYFMPTKEAIQQQNVFVATATFDYSFANSLYLNGAYLHSSNGLSEPINLGDSGDLALIGAFGNLTAKTLFPSKDATFLTASYPISPLWNVSLAGMYGFGMNLAFISPNISVSLREDLEAILVGQSFYMEQNDKMELLGNGFFFRLKWSF